MSGLKKPGDGERVGSYSKSIRVTPTISTGAYTAQDQVGGLQTITNGLRINTKTGAGLSLTIIDKSKQGAEIVVFFFKSAPTIDSSDNAAIDIDDADIAAHCIGWAKVDTYESTAAESVGVATSVNLHLTTDDAQGDLFAVAKTNGTPTYAGTTDLVFVYGNLQD